MRQQITLDGSWQFQIDPGGTLALDDISTWRTIQVPGPWQAQFDDLRLVAGVGWYRRQVEIPAGWAGQTVFLRIGAADYFTEVWINGQAAGQHEGGYLPFEFDITSHAAPGSPCDIVIRVTDPGHGEYDRFPAFPFAEIPHGKQSWYGPVGGIWQSVWLEARAPQFIERVHVTPYGTSGRVSAVVRTQGRSPQGRLHMRCLSPTRQTVANVRAAVSGPALAATFEISQPELWEPDSPALYTLEVTLLDGDEVLDRQEIRFGIRSFEARDGRLWLNGHLFYLRGALDQDYYPDGIYTPPSLDFLRQQVRQARQMGLNCLRCHIKVPDPRYLQAADEEGILIWAEVPSWIHLTEKSGQRVRDTFAGMVTRDWNHPSIVIWTLVNENWGTDLLHSAEDRRWLSETVDWARQLDPTRLIVDNSPCFHNFHVKTHLDDFHFYAAMPEGSERWQTFVSAYAGRPPVTFSPNGDASRTGQEPLVVSEFGNWGLPDLSPLRAAYQQHDPWWFATGQGWNPPVVWPQNAEQRFRDAGLEAVFGGWAGLAQAAQWAQYRALKHEIETMRAEAALSGYVITEWTDLHWECNGLLDMVRNPRVFAGELPTLNADTVLVPRWDRAAYWSGDTVQLGLHVAHHGRAAHEGAVVHWSLEGNGLGGSLPLPRLAPGDVIQAGSLAFQAPPVHEAAARRVVAWLTLSDGQWLARNHQPFAVFDRSLAQAVEPVSVWSDSPDLRTWLAQHGYSLDETRGIRVATALDDSTLAYVQRGGRALVCAAHPEALAALPGPVRVFERQMTPWSGDWASSFAWTRPGVTRVPGGPLIDFTWQGVFPQHVLSGIAPERTLAGLFVGWIHQPVALTGSLPVGDGFLMLTTFPVLPPDGTPVRTVLLHDLIRLTYLL